MTLAAVRDAVPPTSLTRRVWHRFFEMLRDHPFVAVVEHPSGTHRLYTKDVDLAQLRTMRDTLDDYLREHDGQD